jgi:dTDP-4-amino-4,6-dideoxygalactose transaminase
MLRGQGTASPTDPPVVRTPAHRDGVAPSGQRRHIPFNRPLAGSRELGYISEAVANRHLSGDGPFTVRCQDWLEENLGVDRAMMVHSCTAALELAALLLEVGPGDEVIMPSFTFVSTANAFVLRGATPVFVDVRPDTLNIDEKAIEAAVTARTRAIVPVHYAGVPCAMDDIVVVASEAGVPIVEDAAQALLSTYRSETAGSFGQLAALSFHETKNVISGEGGALLINDLSLLDRAEILRDKGTNRKEFLRGEVDRYSWVDVGSSYAMSEINAAFLWAQLECAAELTADRLRTWRLYHDAFAALEDEGIVRRPAVPANTEANGHIYYLLTSDEGARDRLLRDLGSRSINAVFHYAPLHTSAVGRRVGRTAGSLPVTEDVASRLVRLPLWPAMPEFEAEMVIEGVYESMTSQKGH